jgi:hypothetical protein
MNKDDLQRSLDSYPAIREALGFRMHTTRILLTDFVDYLCRHNIFPPAGPFTELYPSLTPSPPLFSLSGKPLIGQTLRG